MGLLKDLTVLDKMYELNLEYLRSSTSTSPPATRLWRTCRPSCCRPWRSRRGRPRPAGSPATGRLPPGDRLRFERRLHDLKLTRTIAIQTAPQIRLIQANDQSLVEKIQTSITNTIPLWKNQIIIALSLYRQQQALALQKAVTDTANELLAKNAEMLRTGSARSGARSSAASSTSRPCARSTTTSSPLWRRRYASSRKATRSASPPRPSWCACRPTSSRR